LIMRCAARWQLLAAVFLLLPVHSSGAELRVAVASNFAPVLTRLAPLFEQQTGHALTLLPGASGRHYTQIINGAPFDVFLAADAERPQLLAARGIATADTLFTYAIGQLVLWSPAPAFVDADAAVLRSGSFRHLAIANPRLAPYGAAARQVLESLALWEALQGRLVQGENITQALQFVQSGNAELGFIAASQWLQIDPQRQGSHWLVPAASHAPLVQQGIVLRDSPAARSFVAFLQSDASRALIGAAGYELP
jgi:molybdate transport system substrate-binding protein